MAVNVGGTDTVNTNLSASRAQAIAMGHSPAEVDAFIQSQGGNRVSDQRLLSAFNVPGVPGTDTMIGPTGGSGAPPGGGGTPGAPSGGGGAPAPTGGNIPLPPSMDALTALTSGVGGGGGGTDTGGGGILNLAEAPASLRSLGRRNPAQESMELASKGRRVY